jgi:hypothetical protein
MEALAQAIVELHKSFDYYEFRDGYDTDEEAHEAIMGLLSNEHGMQVLATFIRRVADEI